MLSLIALVALTNVAQALRDDPGLASRLDVIVISGGAMHVEKAPAPNAPAEWNLFIDPHAADLVFRSGAPLVLVPLDATGKHDPSPILLNRDLARRFAADAHGRESQLVVRLMLGSLLTDPGAKAVPLGDAVEPAVCADWRDLSIHVALDPDAVIRETLVDANGEPNVRVYLAGDQVAFETAYLADGR